MERYLENVYERQQGQSGVAPRNPASPVRGQTRDMRLDFVNTTRYRNDIEIQPFPSTATGYGRGGATITLAELLDDHGSSLSAVVGGELVTLLIRGRSTIDIHRPLVGFLLKNRTGQILFGDNTYMSYLDRPPQVLAHHEFEATFTFRMPTLPVGDYVVAVAIADGSHQEHVQHHWIHDAVVLKSLSSSVATGLMGIPMHSIKLTTRASQAIEL